MSTIYSDRLCFTTIARFDYHTRLKWSGHWFLISIYPKFGTEELAISRMDENINIRYSCQRLPKHPTSRGNRERCIKGWGQQPFHILTPHLSISYAHFVISWLLMKFPVALYARFNFANFPRKPKFVIFDLFFIHSFAEKRKLKHFKTI